jgi:16S rRNA (uracil1498-N3)-methyltransferase
MSIHRFYCETIVEPLTELTDNEALHLVKVIRASEGDVIELFEGKLAAGNIRSISKKKVVLNISSSTTQKQREGSKIIIAVSLAKGDRFDWLISKCTELGVDCIYPVLFERTVKQASNPKAVERWRNISISAAKQSKRLFLPEIEEPIQFKKLISKFEKDSTKANLLFGSLDKKAKSLLDITLNQKTIAAFIGPEGGMTEEEENQLIKSGAKAVNLTETILRIETAAVAFSAVLSCKRNAIEKMNC